MLSAIAFASFAMVFADAGAMTIISAHSLILMWLCSFAQDSFVSSSTLFDESVSNVRGVMNFFAAGVITTFTSAPAFTKYRKSSRDL